MPIVAVENSSFSSCSTWSRIIDISGETTIIIEFSKVRAALAERGKIKLLPKPEGIIAKTSLPRAKSQTLVQSTRQRGFIKITRAIRVGHLGDDKLMTTPLSEDVNCQLTNQRVYQLLIYRNRPLKKMRTGSAALSLPSPRAFFAFSFYWTTFHHHLGAWNRLRFIIACDIFGTGQTNILGLCYSEKLIQSPQ